MSATLQATAAAPAALSAFLRGVERRAAVFADLQCGERATAERALAAAMRAFRNHALALPMADWPQRFWTLLAATPGLRQAAAGAGAGWPVGMEALVVLDPAPRLALLLRLAAGLEEEAAAAAGGLDPASYREALAAACPRDAGGEPDPVAWRALAEAIQQQVRGLPPERLAGLARLREAAIEGPRPAQAATREAVVQSLHSDRSTPRPPAWRWRALAAVIAALALALLVARYWPERVDGGDVAAPWGDPEVVVEALPGAPPAARYTDAQALLLHPDLELLLDPEERTVVRDADFLAWYLASTEVRPEAIDEPSDAVEAVATEGVDDVQR